MALAAKVNYLPPKVNIYDDRRSGNGFVRGDVKIFTPDPDTTTRLRILPDLSEAQNPIPTFWMHAKPKPLAKDTTLRDLWCPESIGSGSCEICKVHNELRGSHSNDVLKEFFPRRPRRVARVIVRGRETDGVMLWFVPKSVMDSIVAFAVDWQERFGTDVPYDITHPDEGVDIRFRRVGKGFTTSYAATSFATQDPTPLSEDEDQALAWLEKCKEPIASLLSPPSEEQVAYYLTSTKGLLLAGEKAEAEAAKMLEGDVDDDSIPF